jgi:hypothetical protein
MSAADPVADARARLVAAIGELAKAAATVDYDGVLLHASDSHAKIDAVINAVYDECAKVVEQEHAWLGPRELADAIRDRRKG